MIPKVKLGIQPIKEWEEKDPNSNWRKGSVRLYVGKLWVGPAEPLRNEDAWFFHSMLNDVSISDGRKHTLEEIKHNVELGLKEYIKKFAKIIHIEDEK